MNFGIFPDICVQLSSENGIPMPRTLYRGPASIHFKKTRTANKIKNQCSQIAPPPEKIRHRETDLFQKSNSHHCDSHFSRHRFIIIPRLIVVFLIVHHCWQIRNTVDAIMLSSSSITSLPTSPDKTSSCRIQGQ